MNQKNRVRSLLYNIYVLMLPTLFFDREEQETITISNKLNIGIDTSKLKRFPLRVQSGKIIYHPAAESTKITFYINNISLEKMPIERMPDVKEKLTKYWELMKKSSDQGGSQPFLNQIMECLEVVTHIRDMDLLNIVLLNIFKLKPPNSLNSISAKSSLTLLVKIRKDIISYLSKK